MPSGFGDVTRWPPRTDARALRIASRLAPLFSSRRWPSPPTSAVPRRRCSVETYSSPSLRASSWARSTTRLARGSRVSVPPAILARLASAAASSARNAGRSTPRRRRVSAGTPSSGSRSAERRCSASSTGLCSRSASDWAVTTASWAFWVNFSSCISWFLWWRRRPPWAVALGDRVGRPVRGSGGPPRWPRRPGRSAGRRGP